MSPASFGERLDALRPCLKEYGKYVIQRIMASLEATLTVEQYSQLIKVGPSFRVKDTLSAVEKIERKAYDDPVSQVTDVVGVRFVVLLDADIALVERAIVNCNAWTPRKDRSPLFEVHENPEVFDYQSTHFIVRANDDIKLGDFVVPRDTPCEIQIRTLVQHAYAEFVHDRVYKAGKEVPSNVRRLVARSMAMLESTDLIFSEAAEELACINLSLEERSAHAAKVYANFGQVATAVSEAEAQLFFETFRDVLSGAHTNDVRRLFEVHSAKVIEAREEGNMFSHPFVVLVLWVLAHHDQIAADRWPLGKYRADLVTAASFLGIALPH